MPTKPCATSTSATASGFEDLADGAHMKQSLSLGLRQQLKMTPQLQQAIRLLQLSALDLQREIQELLETNPMLEEADDEQNEPQTGGPFDSDTGAGTATAPLLDPDSDGTTTAVSSPAGADRTDEAEGNVDAPSVDTEPGRPIPEELPVDSNWDDIFQPVPAPALSGSSDGQLDIENNDGFGETLKDHLRWQLNLTPFSDVDRLIATAIIDAVNADGMLEASIDDLLESFDASLDIGSDEVRTVLKRIQHFDPTGVAARNLAECLALQLEALDASTPWRSEALCIVTEHLGLLGSKDFATLKRRTRLSERQLARIAALIQSLNPRPGAALAAEPAEYVIPDVVVRKAQGRWLVELNPEATPALRINTGYAGLVRRADNSRQNTWLRDNLQEARWFLKSLESRHDTLLRVATKIVEIQRGFLEYGEQAMRPLVLNDVAEAVNLHESTISRVTSRKTMQTPRGLFELKYFFSSRVVTTDGEEVSSTAIRALIRNLIAGENPRKPLSDNKIAAILAQRNINVARRTVAKYRESMSIPPSSGRKRLV